MDITKTKSYELVTLLDKSKVDIKYKYKYLFMFLLKYIIYKFKINRKIKKYDNKKKIDLFIDLFKEYVYLQQIINNLNITFLSLNSTCELSIDNGTMRGNIYYKYENNDDKVVCIKIEHSLITGGYCIYLDTSKYLPNNMGFNITEQNLKNKEKYDTFYNLLNLFFNDILYILIRLYNYYIKNKLTEETNNE